MTVDDVPSLADIVSSAISSRFRGLAVSMPARVERYDASKQLIDAQPLIQSPHQDEEGATRWSNLPVVTNVPVVFPGAGGFRLTFPIQTGDTVLLVCADGSLDRWLDLGGVVNPEDDRMHDRSDAIAIPGLHPFNANWTGASTSDATVGKDGGPQIVFKAGEIHLGAADGNPATEDVIKGTTYWAAEDVLMGALSDAMAALTTAIAAVALPATTDFTAWKGVITGAASEMAKIAAAVAAIAAFRAGGVTYKSTIMKTK